MASLALLSLCKMDAHATLVTVIRDLLPCMQATSPPRSTSSTSALDHMWFGTLYAFSRLLVGLDTEQILPYVVFLLRPHMALMNSQSANIAQLATTSFAHLVQIAPLEAAAPNPQHFDDEFLERKELQRQWLNQLLQGGEGGEKLQLPSKLNVTLRAYQTHGVQWLNFLRRSHLHGALCDDMGLGKTIQESNA